MAEEISASQTNQQYNLLIDQPNSRSAVPNLSRKVKRRCVFSFVVVVYAPQGHRSSVT